MGFAFTGTGDTIQIAAPADLQAGDGFFFGSLFCVAMAPAKKGSQTAVRVSGSFVMQDAKLTGGEVVEYDGRPIGIAIDSQTVRLVQRAAPGAAKSAIAPKKAATKRKPKAATKGD